MEAKTTILLVQSSNPIVNEKGMKPFSQFEASDWATLEQKAEQLLSVDSLDITALHLCAIKIRANYAMPACFKDAMGQQKILAEKGDLHAINNYGYFLYLLEEHQGAINQFNKAIRQGSPAGMYNRARMYDFGLGSEVKRKYAIPLYFQAAKKGLTTARLLLEANRRDPVTFAHIIVLDILNMKTTVDMNNINLYMIELDVALQGESRSVFVILFEEVLNLLTIKKMEKDQFVIFFDWLMKSKFFSNRAIPSDTAKIWEIFAKALQQSMLSWDELYLTLPTRYYLDLFEVLNKSGERQLLSEIILSCLNTYMRDDRIDCIRHLPIDYFVESSDLAAIIFMEGFADFLTKIVDEFKKEPSFQHASLLVLNILSKYSDAKLQLNQCHQWYINYLIEHHRKHKQDEDLVELGRYQEAGQIGEKASRYLRSLSHQRNSELGEKLKDDGIKGDVSAYTRLVAESGKSPELMYWLGRYYEEFPSHLYLTYPAKAVDCYKKSIAGGSLLACERLADCYEKGKLVKQDLEKALYYHYEAGKRGSAHSIGKLKEGFKTQKLVIFASLYLAMLHGLRGAVSRYYDNPFLRAAVNLDKHETDTAIMKLSNNPDLEVHLRLALVQVAFSHNPLATAAPHKKMITLFNFSKSGSFDDEKSLQFAKEIAEFINPYYLSDLVLSKACHSLSTPYVSMITSVALNLFRKIDVKDDELIRRVQQLTSIWTFQISLDPSLTVDQARLLPSPTQRHIQAHSSVEKAVNKDPFLDEFDFVEVDSCLDTAEISLS